MTELLFRDDAYLKSAPAELVDLTDNGGLIFNQTVFYPIGGGQPSDVGELISDDLNLKVREVRKGDQGKVVFFVEGSTEGIQIGQKFQQKIDWATRYGYENSYSFTSFICCNSPWCYWRFDRLAEG